MGGANSCFYRGIRNAYPDANYIIIDNNDTGLNLFMENNSNKEFLQGYINQLVYCVVDQPPPPPLA